MENRRQTPLSAQKLPQQNKPLIEILSDQRVLIEHHKGICIYEPTLMQIKVCFGFIEVTGSSLMISCMSKDQLVINGRIEGVKILRGSSK